MSDAHQLGDLQAAIMDVLWQRGEAAVTEVHSDLEPVRGLAPTTIATMLKKMEVKGVVTYRRDGRRFLYRPVVSRAEVRRSMVGELTRRLFGGRPTALVGHLLDEQGLDAEELDALKLLIAEHEEASS